MLRYPVKLRREDGRVLVDFPDFPEAHTYGDDKDEALARAQDALATVIDAYMRDRRPIPPPSRGRTTVDLSPLLVAKVALHNEMLAQRVTKAELGRRLHWHTPQVDRVLNPRHASKLDQMEQALAAVGKGVELVVVALPAHFSRTGRAGARSRHRGTRERTTPAQRTAAG